MLRQFQRCRIYRESVKRTISTAAPSQGLSRQKCVITGASRGIGRAIAHRFAQDGASCVLVGRDEATLKPVLKSLSQREGSNHESRVGDTGERRFWENLIKEVQNVDICVNAAGVTHYSLLATTNPQLIENILKTNLTGTIWACQMMTKSMLRRRKGCIINVSSLLGAKGGRGNVVYAASKAGIIGLTRSLAAEVGQSGIRVNALLPGYIETQMTDNMTPEGRKEALENIPMKRFGRVTEVADAAAFLATNAYANNCVLNLDGGLSAV